jgi:hypothetical protein
MKTTKIPAAIGIKENKIEKSGHNVNVPDDMVKPPLIRIRNRERKVSSFACLSKISFF